MRCNSVQKMLGETGPAELAAPAQKHLEACAECRTYADRLAELQAGMSLLGHEAAPEPSLGFSARVLRRLHEENGIAPDFLESAGRRVILATLVLVFTLLLAMILPASGPVRRRPRVRAYWPQPQATSAVNYPVEWNNAPAVPVLVEVRPAVYRGN